MMRIAVLILAAGILAVGCARTRPTTADHPRDSVHLQQDGAVVDTLVLTKMRNRRVAGVAVTVIERGVVLKNAAYGTANVATGEPVTTSTAFFVASISKTLTAAAVLLLAEDKRLALDQGIGTLLTSLPASWQGVTVRQLLLGTSGLPDLSPTPGVYQPDFDAWVTTVENSPLASPPGDAYRYVGTDYALLGRIIEKVTGAPFEEFVQARIFAPLGISTGAFVDWHDLKPGRAEWYTTMAPNGKYTAEPHLLRTEYPRYVRPAAGLYISAADLGRFVDALTSHRLLRPESAVLVWEPATLKGGRKSDVGMGAWHVADPEDEDWTFVEGGNRSTVMLARKRGLLAVVLTNTQGAIPVTWVGDVLTPYLEH